MKDIDTLLRSITPAEPRRDISSNFSSRIVTELKAQPTLPRKESIFMRLLHKPMLTAMLAAIVLLALGGTTYAATDGFTRPFDLRNIFSYQEHAQPDGTKVLSVQTKDCTNTAAFYSGKGPISDQALYLKINQDATVRTEDALRFVQGYCDFISSRSKLVETTMLAGKNQAIMPTFLQGEIVGKTDTSVTLKSYYRMKKDTVESFQTTATVNQDTLLYDNNQPLASAATLQIGDFVWMTTVTELDEQTAHEALYLNRMSKEEGFFLNPTNAVAKNIKRVLPCSDNPHAFCDWTKEVQKPVDQASLQGKAKEAYDFVSAAYDAYIAPHSGATNGGMTQAEEAALLSAFTSHVSEAAAYSLTHSGQDTGSPIICGAFPTSRQVYSRPITVGSTQMIVLSADFGNGSLESLAEITYDPGIKKITSVECAASLPIQ